MVACKDYPNGAGLCHRLCQGIGMYLHLPHPFDPVLGCDLRGVWSTAWLTRPSAEHRLVQHMCGSQDPWLYETILDINCGKYGLPRDWLFYNFKCGGRGLIWKLPQPDRMDLLPMSHCIVGSEEGHWERCAGTPSALFCSRLWAADCECLLNTMVSELS
jgi:hypothetical protein